MNRFWFYSASSFSAIAEDDNTEEYNEEGKG